MKTEVPQVHNDTQPAQAVVSLVMTKLASWPLLAFSYIKSIIYI